MSFRRPDHSLVDFRRVKLGDQFTPKRICFLVRLKPALRGGHTTLVSRLFEFKKLRIVQLDVLNGTRKPLNVLRGCICVVHAKNGRMI